MLIVIGTDCGQYCEPNTWEEVTCNQLYTQYLYTLSRNCKWYWKKNTKEMNKLNYNDDLLKGDDQYWWDKSWSEFVFVTYAQILPANFSNAMAASLTEYGQIHGLEWPWYFSW